jgi:hypothetical protein
MPQAGQVVNIKKMSVLNAKGMLHPLHTQALSSSSIPQHDHRILKDATEHSDPSVCSYAFEIIKNLADRTPFYPEIKKEASLHADHTRTAAALDAIGSVHNLSPFYETIKAGIISQNAYIARFSLVALARHTAITHVIPKELQQDVIDAVDHHSVPHVIEKALEVVQTLSDKRPFFLSLQNRASLSFWPVFAKQAADILKGSTSPVNNGTNDAPVPQAVIYNKVMLDFNIEANGGGPGEDRYDVAKKLCAVFDESAKAGPLRAKAKVFSKPNSGLKEDDIIDVRFTAKDSEKILSSVSQGVTREFDLETTGDGIYIAKLAPQDF